MGNEFSKPEPPSGRSRSLSPLPRDDELSNAEDDLRQLPSTMPAAVMTEDLKPALSPPPEPPKSNDKSPPSRDSRKSVLSPEPHLARSRSSSPDEKRISATQPVRSAIRDGSPAKLLQSATQPEISEAQESHSSKRRSKEAKAKRKRAEDRQSLADGETNLHESTPKKKRKRRSDARRQSAGVDETPALVASEPTTAIEKVVSPYARPTSSSASAGRDGDSGKDKVPITGTASRSMSDSEDEAPPSAQPPSEDDWTGSSKPRKRRRLSSDGNMGGHAVESFNERLDHMGSGASATNGTANGIDVPASPSAGIKAEREESPEPNGSRGHEPHLLSPVATTSLGRPRALSTGSSPPQSDSGSPEADDMVKSEPGVDADMQDGEPQDQDDNRRTSGIIQSQEDDDNMSIVPESPGSPSASDSPPHQVAEAAGSPDMPDSSNELMNGVEQESPGEEDGAGKETSADDPALSGSDEDAATPKNRSRRAASKTETRSRNGELDAHTESQDQHMEKNTAKAVTPGSSAKSPGQRPSTKRKAKQPFFEREEEENANAFSELPPDDAVVQPSPTGLKRARKSATAAAKSSEASQGPKKTKKAKKKSKDRPVGDATVEDPEDAAAPAKSQYRSGPLSKTEQAQVIAAVERFREAENMTEQEINQLIRENPQKSGQSIHRQFWTSIQDACPSRPRQKLINWCRLQQRFHDFPKRGTWTKEEDDELARLVELHGRKWSMIAGMINRHHRDVRDRWRNYLVCGDKVKKDVWSDGEEQRLRDLVEESVEMIQKDLRSSQKSGKKSAKSAEELINWQHISESMGRTRSRLQCQEKWKRIRAAEPLHAEVPTVLPSGNSWRLQKARMELRRMTAKDKHTLMCAVRDSKAPKETKIPWKHIVRTVFGGRYERQALVVTWGRLRQAVPGWEQKTTFECAEHLCEQYEKEGNFGVEADGDNQASERVDSDQESDHAKENGETINETAPSSPANAPKTLPEARKKSRKRPKSNEINGTAPSSPADAPKTSPESRRKSRAKHKENEVPLPPIASISSLESGGPRPGLKVLKKARRSDVPPSPAVLGSRVDDIEDSGPASAGSHGSPNEQQTDRAERDGSPELGTQLPDLSPSVEAQAARNRMRQHKARAAERMEYVSPPEDQETDTKTPKRRRRSSASDKSVRSPKSKRRNAAVVAELDSIEEPDTDADGRETTTAQRRGLSVISSDMDDMEDIPATLPTPSQGVN